MFTEEILQPWNPAPLRDALTAAEYTRPTLEKLGLYRPGEPGAREELAHRVLPPDSPLLTACRLFDHGLEVSAEASAGLFGPAEAGLQEIGLLETTAGRVRSAAKIEVSDHGWFAFDHPSALSAGKPDYVMGDGNSSKMLAALATGRKGQHVLDLGTGAGWGALRLAERGCRVTAIDLNARAIGFARFNARLAGLEDIEFLVGDRFEPVAGRRFAGIASNPPFVISPENTFVFRDGGVRGDGFCESLARQFGDYLEDGGIAVMILNWFDTGEEDWHARPLEWTAASGCDAWLFRSDRHDPADYGFRWLRETLQGRTPGTAELNRWTDYYRELGAAGINLGFLAMQRRTGSHWTRCDSRSTVKVVAGADREIERIFACETWLRATSPNLLDVPFLVPPGFKADLAMELEGRNGWEMHAIRFRSAGQLAYDGQIDRFIFRLLEVCACGGTPRQMLDNLQPSGDPAETAAAAQRTSELVRELVRHGLLLPPELAALV